jgi:hypothetical protein
MAVILVGQETRNLMYKVPPSIETEILMRVGSSLFKN